MVLGASARKKRGWSASSTTVPSISFLISRHTLIYPGSLLALPNPGRVVSPGLLARSDCITYGGITPPSCKFNQEMRSRELRPMSGSIAAAQEFMKYRPISRFCRNAPLIFPSLSLLLRSTLCNKYFPYTRRLLVASLKDS